MVWECYEDNRNVMRIIDNRLHKKYLLWQSSGSKLVARPKNRWNDSLRDAIDKRDSLRVIKESHKYLNRL